MEKVRDRFRHFRQQPAFTGFVLFMGVLLLNIAVEGPAKFFSLNYLNSMFISNVPFLLVVVAQGILMLSGQLDCSIGMQVALVNVVCIMTVQEWGIPVWAGWILAIFASLAASAVCGVLEAVFRLPALLCSYALVYVIKGVNVLIMPIEQGKVPKEYYKVYHRLLGGVIPCSLLILIAVLVILAIVARTKFFKHVYAVGGNARNAFAAGIDSTGVRMKAFFLKGLIVGIAGIALTLMSASGNPLQCEEYGMRSLAACIIGGMGWGGWGSVGCAAFGGGFYVLISNFVYFLFSWLPKVITGFTASSYYHNLVSDVIVFLGLIVTVYTMKQQRKTLQQGLHEDIAKLTKEGRKKNG